ncbi:hypothetical protein CHLRE_06g290100v5 [Chlamydomonas reinhardtii]|uniref:Syntaxin 6 n=1 Tax=Chlamydomonas reinhardtii TaxID=3055 RepID=Q8S4W5_CHLRE|nr:uncharacterized protein CHLRE_06g290100v5 [Chlamydomonas reinhardtii]AAM12662.1 syntaxin 6 [Chlamydomonas reinhardtii]PNW82698.1 hypothetical protein CHLRE_06g290100v5 [Chlamydomonas reinhardtii]|eukprot:XP_001695523.1 Qc-SNARE protein, Tlg1/Syntaxin 6-family [Chlamydomonas reinhardtii]
MPSNDPFYLIRQEIQDSVNELQQRMSRFHGLTATNPERKKIAQTVEEGCGSLSWQLNELDTAVDRASENPQRFNLTPEELSSRRRWITNTRRQLDGMKDTLRTATAPAPAVSAAESKAIAQNDKFLTGQYESQQLVMKRQDQDLEDIEQAVIRIGRQGREIGNELAEQERMLDELDQDVDTTHSRLKAAQKKMQELIRKSGSNTQLVLIVVLIVILVLLATFAFM